MMPFFGALRWRLKGIASLTLALLRGVLRVLADDLGVVLLDFEIGVLSLVAERCFLRTTGSS